MCVNFNLFFTMEPLHSHSYFDVTLECGLFRLICKMLYHLVCLFILCFWEAPCNTSFDKFHTNEKNTVFEHNFSFLRNISCFKFLFYVFQLHLHLELG